MQLSYRSPEGQVQRAFEDLRQPVALALVNAMRRAGELIQSRGRANISSAGFSKRFVQGFNAVLDRPRAGEAIGLRVFHRIGYAGIFEHGGRIVGKPLLWLPIEANLPRDRRWTPRRFVRSVGPLASARGRPLLVGRPPGFKRPVPVFVGVRSVELRKRFNINAIVDNVMGDFESLYESSLRI